MLVGWTAAVAQLRLDVVSLRHVRCAGLPQGMIEVRGAGGNIPYEYSLDGEIFQRTGLFEGLTAATWQITVRDRLGARATLDVEVREPARIRWTSAETTPPTRCDGLGDGSIRVQAEGGVAPIEYELQGMGIRRDGLFGGLPPGSYRLRAIDGNECTRDTFIVLPDPMPALDLSFEAIGASCADMPDGIIIVSGDIEGLEFSADGVFYQSENVLQGLDGRRVWTVYTRNAGGCLRADNVLVPGPPPLSVRPRAVQPATCQAADGRIIATAEGGTPPYRYLLTDGGPDTLRITSGIFENLKAGTWDLIVSDANGCQALTIIDLTERADFGLSLDIQQPACLQKQNGAITVSAETGEAPFRYRIDDGPWQEESSFDSLSQGLFRLTVEDARGCQQDTLFELVYKTQLSLEYDIRMPSCSEDVVLNDGEVRVKAAGGTQPYEYSRDAATYSADSVFRDLETGALLVVVRDADGCQTDDFVFLYPFRQIAKELEITPVSCKGDATGAIRVRVLGGNAGFRFGLSPQRLSPEDSVFSGLQAGVYTVITQDPFGCMDIDTTQVAEPDSLQLLAELTGVSCPDRADGVARLSAVGGSGPVRMYWVQTGDTLDLPLEINDLDAGFYGLTMIDAAGCTASDAFEITVPSMSLQVEASVCGGTEGRIGTRAEGLRLPVRYALVSATDSIAQDEPVFENLPVGLYGVRAIGAGGCVLADTATITGPQVFALEVVSRTASTCRTSDGSIEATATGGRRPYRYSLNGQGFQSDSVFAFLAPGEYEVRAQDSAGCLARRTVFVEQPPAQFMLTLLTQDVRCHGRAEGSARVEVRNGMPPYQIEWAGQGSGEEIGQLRAGQYAVLVSDQSGCLRRDTARIAEPEELRVSLRIDTTGTSYRVTVLATGGTQPYRYSLNDSLPQTDSVFRYLREGSYVLAVIDAQSCTVDAAFDLEPIAVSRKPKAPALAAEIYPNPADDRAIVRFPVLVAGDVRYRLLDALGRVAQAGSWPGGGAAVLDLADLPAGLYLLELDAGAAGRASLRLLRR